MSVYAPPMWGIRTAALVCTAAALGVAAMMGNLWGMAVCAVLMAAERRLAR